MTPTLGLPDQSDSRGAGGSLEPDRHPRPDVRQPPSLPRVADPVGGADSLDILADRLTRLEKAGLVSRRDDPCLDNRILLMTQFPVGLYVCVGDNTTMAGAT